MTENKNEITVLIVGNPDASSGESVLLNINNSPLKSNELGKTFYDAITSDYYIEMVHGEEYMSYTYVVNPAKVHSSGSNRPGMFWIGVTVSKGKQIVNTYDLLIELKDKFQELYMTKLSDGSYEFINKDYSAVEFRKIVDKYKTDKISFSEYCQMTGSQMSVVNLTSDNNKTGADKIKMFLDDTQYTDFEGYSSIIVAEDISVTSQLKIEVPRLREFEVKCKEGEGTFKDKLGKIDNKNNKTFKGVLSKDIYNEDITIEFSIDDFKESEELKRTHYTLTKGKNEIIVSGNFVKRKFEKGIDCKNGKIGDHISNIVIKAGGKEKEIKNDNGYFIEFLGEEVRTKLYIESKNPRFDYKFGKTDEIDIDGNDNNDIYINVVKFEAILIKGLPSQDNDQNRKVSFEVKGKDKQYDMLVKETYNKGICKFTIDEFQKEHGFSPAPDDITAFKYTSDKYKNGVGDKKSYEGGILTIELNKETLEEIISESTQNSQTQGTEKQLKVYNKIENSVIHLSKVYIDDDNNGLEVKEEIKNEQVRGKNQKKPDPISIPIPISVESLLQVTFEIEKVEYNNGDEKKYIKPVTKEIEADNYKVCIEEEDIKTYTQWERILNGIKSVFSSKCKSGFILILSLVLLLLGCAFLGAFIEHKYNVIDKIDNVFNREQKQQEQNAANNKKTCDAYYTLMKKCGVDLTFEKIDEIAKWCETINIDNYKYFDTIKNYIGTYKEIAECIKNKEIISENLYNKSNLPKDFSKNLKEYIEPLSDRHADCIIFNKIIKNNNIVITSFHQVQILYKENETNISNIKDTANQISRYYTLMKECGENFTFDMIDEIADWVNNNNSSKISDDNKFITVEKYIDIYKKAADAVREFKKMGETTNTSVDWFESKHSKYLYDVFMTGTKKDDDDKFCNKFRSCITYLLGGNKTLKAGKGDGINSLYQKAKITISDNRNKIHMEINHMKTDDLDKDKKYLLIDEEIYDNISQLMANFSKINSFADLKICE